MPWIHDDSIWFNMIQYDLKWLMDVFGVGIWNEAPEHALRFPQRVAQLLLEAASAAQFLLTVDICWTCKLCSSGFVMVSQFLARHWEMIEHGLQCCRPDPESIFHRKMRTAELFQLLYWAFLAFSLDSGECVLPTLPQRYCLICLEQAQNGWLTLLTEMSMVELLNMSVALSNVSSNVMSCLVPCLHACSISPQWWLRFSAVQVLPSSWHLKGNTMTSKRQAFE